MIDQNIGGLYRLSYLAKPMIWGGNKLKAMFDLATQEKIGEVWSVCGFSDDSSILLDGPLKGLSLFEVYQHYPKLFNTNNYSNFPLLIKFIDANENLSVQIHPDDEYAQKHHQSFGKSEAWLVLSDDPNSILYLGHTFNNPDQLVNAIKENNVLEGLGCIKPKLKDIYYVSAKTIHAIGAKTFIYELQQSSKITYRVFDYNRVDQFNKQRELHLQQSLPLINFPDAYSATKLEVNNNASYKEKFLTTDFFTMRVIETFKQTTILLQENTFNIIGVIENSGVINTLNFNTGTHALATVGLNSIEVSPNMTIVISYPN